MTSFAQWRSSWGSQAPLKKVIWLCGDADVWVDEVATAIQRRFTRFFEADQSVAMAMLPEFAKDFDRNIVVITDAEQIEDWSPLRNWLETRPRACRTHLLFISNEPSIALAPPRRGEKPSRAEHILAIQERGGQVIECRRPTSPANKLTAQAWLKAKLPMTDYFAKFMLDRALYDLRAVRDAAVKLAAIRADISSASISAVLDEVRGESFVDALIKLDKPTAMALIPTVRDIDSAISTIDSRLDFIGRVYELQSDRMSPPEIKKAIGKQAWALDELIEYAKHYDARRRLAIRKTLATIDSAHRAGETKALLEALVLAW